MATRVDPLLAMLISSLRELPDAEKEDMVLSERRRIMVSNESDPHIRYSNVLKAIYMRMMSYSVNGIDFLNACESDVSRIKAAGYLGMMAMESSEYVIMMTNTIMKDLGRKETRNDALTAICNLRDEDTTLAELVRHICPSSRGDPFHKKTLVAFHRLSPDADVSMVGQDPAEVYVKTQIVLDRYAATGEASLAENDILFLQSLFVKNTNAFLRVKLLQLFRVLHSRKMLDPQRDLLEAAEAAIIPARDKMRPQIEIALAIEAAQLLLETGRRRSAESFVFRLIESQNPNSRFFGFRIARKYRIHREIATDRCIKTGIHDRECLKTLVSLVSKSTHKMMHKRKEEMVFYMEKAGADRQTISTALVALFSRVAQHSRDDFLIRMYQEIPEICLKMPFDRNIPREQAVGLFNKIYITVNSRYFPLIYQLLPAGTDDAEFCSLLFEKHLNILVIKRAQECDTLARLLDCMLAHGVPERNRAILISKHQEISTEDGTTDVLDMMLNTIYLLNSRIHEQAVLVGDRFVFSAGELGQ